MLVPKIRIVSSSNIKKYAKSENNLINKNFGTHTEDYIEIGGRIEPYAKYYLMSYQFTESVNNFSGSFSVTIYEDIDVNDTECIFSRVRNLDVVFIYENSEKDERNLEKNDPVFIGVVHSKNIKSMMNNGKVNRITTLEGTGIYSLIGDLSVSLDIHSLTGVDAAQIQSEFTEKIKSKKTYKDIVMSLWDSFVQISEKVSKQGVTTSHLFLKEMLLSFYPNSVGMEDWFEFSDTENLKYPIAASFFNQSVNNFSDMLRTLLPSNVFEIFGRVGYKGTPYLTIREMPFSPEKWVKLPIATINPLFLTGYTISQNDSEVYNAFLAYIEGSAEDPAKYLTLAAIDNKIQKNTEKMSKYGYRPLQVTFRGYDISSDLEKDDKPSNTIIECTKKLKDWYGELDELYSGTINLVRGQGDMLPAVGERVKFINYEFYVTDKSHNWSFGNPINITLNVSRGGFYNKAGMRDKNSPESKEKFGSRYAELKKYLL